MENAAGERNAIGHQDAPSAGTAGTSHSAAAGSSGGRWVPLRIWAPTVGAVLGLLGGGLLHLVGIPRAGDALWGAVIVVFAALMVREIIASLRLRRPGVDVIALLALGGAVVLGELLAGVIISVMLATGRALERYASERARRELTALLAGVPRTAHIRRGDDVHDVGVDAVVVGDLVIVRPGESVPVDGVLLNTRAVLDESAVTGESRPVEHDEGARLVSGTVNAGSPFELRAAATAGASTYAGIVRLVEQAQAERAPFVRLADRAAGFFVPLTLVVAAAAWLLSGDPVRALAVLVVATPCPLILATPVAITSGISRLARRGVIVKGGGALETLARVRHVLLDKTGTVTAGRPRLIEVVTFDGADPDDVLRAAGSLEQLSAHVFAPAIVQEARARSLDLVFPTDAHETAGAGITGLVGDMPVRIGRIGWIVDGPPPPAARAVRRRAQVEGTSAVFVSTGSALVGAVLLEDRLRPEAGRTVRALRRRGVERVTLLTGDHADVADLIGAAIDVDRVMAERTPQDKVDEVRAARQDAVIAMVGDGVNDAPALAHAHVGIAMGAAGAAASSEAADIVIAVDRFDRLADAIAVAQRTRGIAWGAIRLGMGLAAVAMVAAALGFLQPVGGALVQEAIDVVAILYALRALSGPERQQPSPQATTYALNVMREHRRLQSDIDRLRVTAAQLPSLSPQHALPALRCAVRFLNEELLPHEAQEEREIYPLAATARGDDSTGPLRHTHREITRVVRLLTRTVEQLAPGGPSSDDVLELQRLMFGLHAILLLHTAQEEELYSALDA